MAFVLAYLIGTAIGWPIGSVITWYFICNGRKGAPFNASIFRGFGAYYTWIKANRPEYKNLVLWGER